MWLRALLLCDDVRFELTGQMTLVGVHGERLVLPPAPEPDAPIVLQRAVVVAVLGGLVGQSRISWRLGLAPEEADAPVEPARASVDAHDPRRFEHVLVSLHAPLVIGAPGRYRFALDVSVPGESHSFALPFEVVRATGAAAE